MKSKYNTWAIQRHNYIIASQSYDSVKSDKELISLAMRFVEDHNIYNYKLKIVLGYKEGSK